MVERGRNKMKRRTVLNSSLSALILATAIVGPSGIITTQNTPAENFLATMTTFPTNPFYNPSFGYSNFHYVMRGASGTDQVPIAIYSNTASGNLICGKSCPDYTLYNANQGTLYIPIGLASDHVAYNDCVSAICGINFANWSYKLPTGIPDYCSGQPTSLQGLDNSNRCYDVRGFDLQGGVTGANGGILLTSANPAGDPTCTNYNGGTPDKGNVPSNSCWAADYAVVQAAQAVNPPCISGVTACISSSSVTAESNTTVVDPIINGKKHNGTFVQIGTQITQKTWYIYREITSLAVQIIPPTITLVCTKTNTGVTNVCTGSSANVCGLFAIDKCDPMPSLISALPTFKKEINTASLLTNTRISFGLNVVGFGGLTCNQEDLSSGNCWYGIIGAWIGGQGVQTAGCTGSNSCSFGVTGQPHAQLPIFQDAQLTNPATIPPVDQLVNLAQLTNETMSTVVVANTYSQVFTYVDTQDLGVQYASTPTTCSMDSLNQCFNTPPALIVNVPIVYDIIGAQSLATWLYKYPGIPPNGGTTSGFVSGQVIDASSKNLFGQYSPLVGACIGVGGPCSGQPAQIQEPTDTNGRFILSNIPPGTYTIWATYPGYSNVFRTNVIVSVGATTVVNYAMSPVSALGLLCLVPPIANPLPYQPPMFGGLCIPSWTLWAAGGIVVGLSIIFAWTYTAPARATAGTIKLWGKKRCP
ncbi:hypothetical protein AUI07_02465 [archaeon 13_2_20CM_2_53_6]|nr:MAG: hypothetical protein AUI07_02465 [archaeon 13_2_20CM_2_53_6]